MKPTPLMKAALVDFGNIEETQLEQRKIQRSISTAPGQAMQNSMLRIELEQWNGANPVRHLQPETIVRSSWANRHEESFLNEDFKNLRDDIENSGGNVQPIKVRPVYGQSGKYEIIFGHRRHQACLDLGYPVLAMIAEADDQKMFIEMDKENRQRKDLTPFEQGIMYARALDAGLFPSARKMADAAGIDLTNLGRTIALARLPEFVLKAFESPLDLQHRWSADLTSAVSERRDEVILIAQAIQSENPRPNAKNVFERLTRLPATSDFESVSHKLAIPGGAGQSGVISIDPSKKTIVISLKNVDVKRANDIEIFIKNFLA